MLGSDNNSGDGKNAHLKFFAVTTQDVIFRISDAADPDAGGDYTVLIREERLDGEGTDCRDDRGSPNCNLHTKEFNSALSGNTASRREGWLSAGDADYWAFSINGAGFTDKGTIRIWVVQYPPSGAGGLQHPKIELYDNHDNVIAENDHHLGTQRAKVRYKEIDHSGIGLYYLRVQQHRRWSGRLRNLGRRLRYAVDPHEWSRVSIHLITLPNGTSGCWVGHCFQA